MERIKVPDAGGDMMTYVKFENEKQLLCTLLENTDFSGIKNTRMRDDDVILCTYPRTGTHWLWEQLRLLLTGQLHVDHEDKEIAMFEFNSHGELDSLPSPRALNTHLWFTQFPAEVRKKGTKLVVLFRNPKDVCVSWYVLHRQGSWYEYKGEFRNWIRPFLEGNVDWGAYSEWLMQWERMMEQHPDHPVHVLSYEDLKKNPVEELTKLSGFLDKDHDLDFLQAVSDACALDNMRAKKGQSVFGPTHPWHEKGLTNSPSIMYRQGKSGGWKEWFTVAQSEQFDHQWSKAMEGSKIFRF